MRLTYNVFGTMQAERDLLSTLELILRLELDPKIRLKNFLVAWLERSILALQSILVLRWIFPSWGTAFFVGGFLGLFFFSMLAARLDASLKRNQRKHIRMKLILIPFTVIFHSLLKDHINSALHLAIILVLGPTPTTSQERNPYTSKQPMHYTLIEMLTGKRRHKLSEHHFTG